MRSPKRRYMGRYEPAQNRAATTIPTAAAVRARQSRRTVRSRRPKRAIARTRTAGATLALEATPTPQRAGKRNAASAEERARTTSAQAATIGNAAAISLLTSTSRIPTTGNEKNASAATKEGLLQIGRA